MIKWSRATFAAMFTSRRGLWAAGGVIVLAASSALAAWTLGREPRSARPGLGSNDPLTRACALPATLHVRTWRGFVPEHSEDVIAIPRAPNFSGTFDIMGHSGPWDYLQNVPLLFYGPGRINARGPVPDPASLIDVYPTVDRILRADLPERQGEPLVEAIDERADEAPPRLVIVVMWDGVGRNVLERWRSSWPTLARLERRGTSYLRASVGSSPSITPAIHANLGTGVWPRTHGVRAIKYRASPGRMGRAFADADPSILGSTTFADEYDRMSGNRSNVGFLGWQWHLPMLGHGLGTPGGDADEVAIIGTNGEITGNDDFYSTPTYVNDFPGLPRHARELDRSDGTVDHRWLGNTVLDGMDDPAWVAYQSDLLLEMLERGHYGSDRIPDLFFTNFKMTDLTGHYSTMDSPEMKAVLEAQDDALADLVAYLDEEVRDYVLILSADHGHPRSPDVSQAWPIFQGELERDLNAHFDVPDGTSLLDSTGALGPFLNAKVAGELGVTAAEVARFLNAYTIGENFAGGQLPEGYEGRANEQIFSASFPSSMLPQALDCTLGSRVPPAGFDS